MASVTRPCVEEALGHVGGGGAGCTAPEPCRDTAEMVSHERSLVMRRTEGQGREAPQDGERDTT